MTGLCIQKTINALNIKINDGWSEGNLQGRTVTVVKNLPGKHECGKKDCIATTYSVGVELPETYKSYFENMFTRISRQTVGCSSVACVNQKVNFTSSREAITVALDNLGLSCSVLKSYEDEWLPVAKGFIG